MTAQTIKNPLHPNLLVAIETTLRAHPSGMKEIELINYLDTEFEGVFPKKNLADSLILFQTHFILFNALYQLQDILWLNQNGHLIIGPIDICLYPFNSTLHLQAMTDFNHAKEYYLDFSNFNSTSRENVDDLIKSFWRNAKAHWAGEDAFKVLGLSYPCNWEDIKQRFRSLANQHHPDKGGDAEKLKPVLEAYSTLKTLYKKNG
ncbi:DNA-J related domain-containing protein [Gynuella sunshinyii]|uniref:DnaJ-class molecular chaperone with C-terminal Zn finger domain n=1 Tax=Gynuella sunshinyii YC6258 TaxID=1445510 RepID=A0A0C5VKQ7_9GAMM|nr:DNA-J related domain-containing protein [Gynuella sunshinyii]AJQ95237.1 dnaJ-class molecular chaperone with C-terminal Zn finger domain [Gynuella sunshinyii YC6258]